jgi:hypothetical protein
MVRQSYTNALNILRGWFDDNALTYESTVDAAVVKSPLYGGTVVSLNSSGKFVPGVATTAMPMILKGSSDGFDVSNPGDTEWYAGQPDGTLSAIVAIGGFEVESTEFDTSEATYAPNTLLTSPTESVVGAGYEAQAGKLYKKANWHNGNSGAVAISTHNICGVVSKGRYKNSHSIDVLAFWPVYFPAGI